MVSKGNIQMNLLLSYDKIMYLNHQKDANLLHSYSYILLQRKVISVDEMNLHQVNFNPFVLDASLEKGCIGNEWVTVTDFAG